MADGLVELIVNIILPAVQLIAVLVEAKDKFKSKEETSQRSRSLPQSLLTSQQSRAELITASSTRFGHDCERLVNIAFQTSQAFPSMMRNSADVDQYLRKELAKQYPDNYFYIILGENHEFGFAVDNGEHFAEIEHSRYRIVIFSTKRNPNIKLDTHDANSQMILKWN